MEKEKGNGERRRPGLRVCTSCGVFFSVCAWLVVPLENAFADVALFVVL